MHFFQNGKVGNWKNYPTAEMVERLEKICEEKLDGSGLSVLLISVLRSVLY
ncbi:putative Sulfotransferase domain, P-loop containing nucleoside triphosphate hydrolase [Helianthus anomalus]